MSLYFFFLFLCFLFLCHYVNFHSKNKKSISAVTISKTVSRWAWWSFKGLMSFAITSGELDTKYWITCIKLFLKLKWRNDIRKNKSFEILLKIIVALIFKTYLCPFDWSDRICQILPKFIIPKILNVIPSSYFINSKWKALNNIAQIISTQRSVMDPEFPRGGRQLQRRTCQSIIWSFPKTLQQNETNWTKKGSANA